MSNKMTEKEARAKLADRMWRLSHLYKIKTKDKRLIILKPNRAQLTYLANESSRDIILKARQLGFSTLKLIEQLDFSITTPNSNSAMIAHKKEKVQVLFEIIRLAFENLPPILKPKVSYDNRNELYFPELNSKIYVAADTRGETVHNLHVSELGYIDRAEEKMLGILESVPKDGIISFESTGNGTSGYFYSIWENPNSEFRKHFYSWLLDEEYQEQTDKTLEELLEEYRPLQIKYGLIPDINTRLEITKEQLAWYIKKVYRHREKVMQEYPCSATEAFVSSGRNLFAFSDLQKHPVSDPIDRKYQDLLIWEQPLKGFSYTIGCDPSEGIGEDNAVIEVLNAHTGEQAAEFVSSNVSPDILAGYLLEIGKFYNNAYIVLEVNNHGFSVRDKIKTKYMNLYRRETFDKRTNSYTEAIGWKTTQITKPLLVDSLEEAVRTEDIKIHSEDLIKEMKTFVRTDGENKKGFGAEGDNKDDRVIAIGLALQGIRHLPKMKKPESIAEKQLKEFIYKKQLERDFPNQPGYTRKRLANYRIRGRGI